MRSEDKLASVSSTVVAPCCKYVLCRRFICNMLTPDNEEQCTWERAGMSDAQDEKAAGTEIHMHGQVAAEVTHMVRSSCRHPV